MSYQHGNTSFPSLHTSCGSSLKGSGWNWAHEFGKLLHKGCNRLFKFSIALFNDGLSATIDGRMSVLKRKVKILRRVVLNIYFLVLFNGLHTERYG